MVEALLVGQPAHGHGALGPIVADRDGLDGDLVVDIGHVVAMALPQLAVLLGEHHHAVVFPRQPNLASPLAPPDELAGPTQRGIAQLDQVVVEAEVIPEHLLRAVLKPWYHRERASSHRDYDVLWILLKPQPKPPPHFPLQHHAERVGIPVQSEIHFPHAILRGERRFPTMIPASHHRHLVVVGQSVGYHRHDSFRAGTGTVSTRQKQYFFHLQFNLWGNSTLDAARRLATLCKAASLSATPRVPPVYFPAKLLIFSHT